MAWQYTGTYSPGGTFVEGQADQLGTDQTAVGAVAASILDSVDALLGTVDGTYHEATVAEVQDGVMFGPASSYEGEYAGGGGGGAGLIGTNPLLSC